MSEREKGLNVKKSSRNLYISVYVCVCVKSVQYMHFKLMEVAVIIDAAISSLQRAFVCLLV